MTIIFLADGFEEIEAISPIDILRRGGVNVLTVGVTGKTVSGSHGIRIECDTTEKELNLQGQTPECVILPGGMPGTLNLEKNEKVISAVESAAKDGAVVGAICAAPSILGKMGLLKGRAATCYPGFEEYLIDAEVVHDSVCISDNVVTANGAGSVFEFAFALADMIAWYTGKKPYGDFSVSERIGESMQCDR